MCTISNTISPSARRRFISIVSDNFPDYHRTGLPRYPHKFVVFQNLTQVLTRTFYTIPCTGLSLRVCLVPDGTVCFLIFLYRYVCIVISGSIQIDEFRISVIFIFRSSPIKVLSRVILLLAKLTPTS